jgi:hypothetical protein
VWRCGQQAAYWRLKFLCNYELTAFQALFRRGRQP